MSKNIVFEGWLTKSPPTKRIWRTKWRRRWFALRQSGELPGQYFLDYYADRNCRRLKGTINLDLCEQVDAGLHMERSGGIFDPKLRGSVFTIQTQSRTYHLEADCEAEMEKWVDAICRVCGLRATNDSPHTLDTYQNTLRSVAAADERNGLADTTGPYIPISECITGVRAQNIVMSTRTPYERVLDSRSNQLYTSQPHIRQNNADFSENDSNLSDDDCKSLNTSQSNIGEWSVAKSFTKLAISHRNGVSESGPPVPPRPPKTLTMGKDERVQKETYHGHPNKVLERQELLETLVRYGQTVQWHDTPRRKSHVGPPPSPGRSLGVPSLRNTDDEEEYSPEHQSMQYCNLPCLPPAVDRALKPRRSSRSIGNISHLSRQSGLQVHRRSDTKVDGLQYLDLDLHDSNAVQSKDQEIPRSRAPVVHGKSPSASESVYKTVDFLKTEAFNITRQDAEASRSNQH